MVREKGALDRQESVEQMEVGTGLFLRARERFLALSELPEAMPGSMLEKENELTTYNPLGSLVIAARVRAIDPLEMLLASILDDEREQMSARPMAMYALVRMSIEAAGVGLWLMHHSRQCERVYRSLCASFDALNEYVNFATVIGTADEVTPYVKFRKKKIERLNELKDAVGPIRKRELKPKPRLWQIMTAVSPTVPPGVAHGPDSPYVIWKLASNFLHGSDHVVRDLSDVQQLTEWKNGHADFMLTPSWQLLASCVAACVIQIEQLDERYAHLATTAYGDRSLLAAG
ncbi:hypothetical protein [Microbacterium maritypicum]|nr:hypothetical protein [Microbacterium liquefaciens]